MDEGVEGEEEEEKEVEEEGQTHTLFLRYLFHFIIWPFILIIMFIILTL